MDNGWISRIAVFCLAALGASTWVFAHPHYTRVKSVLMAEDHLGPSYGGYGYIMSSEAEAAASLEFGCRREDQRKYAAEYCGRAFAPDEEFKSAISQAMQALILERIRAHANEYLALQLAAVDGDRKNVPACFSGYPEIGKIFVSLPARQPSDDEIKAAPDDRKLLLGKFRATGSQLTAGNMVRALLFHDQLTAAEKRSCHKASSSLCSDIRNQLQRVEASFPVLYPTSNREVKEMIKAVAGDQMAKPLRDALGELLGARFPKADTPEKHRAEGAAIYNAGVGSDTSNGLNELEQKIATGARDAREQEAAIAPKINAALAQGLTSVNAAVQKLRDNYVSALCDRAKNYEKFGFGAFLISEPNIVRQTLAEMDPKERAAARMTLCQSGYLHHASQLPDCEGVHATGDRDAETTSVVRSRSFFPFAVDNNYRIRKPKTPIGATPVVSLTVNVESSLSNAETEKMVSNMRAQSNAWFNCQTGAINAIKEVPGLASVDRCPTDAAMADPRVQFKIEFRRVALGAPAAPKVSIHKCYRAELDPPQNTNCRDVRNFTFKECVKDIALRRKLQDNNAQSREGPDLDKYLKNISMPPPTAVQADANSSEVPDFKTMSGTQAARYCKAESAKMSEAEFNREDAGNYTSNTVPGTVLHEVGHLVGLPDEYSDPAYPFQPLGEHNSVMNDSSNAKARLFPRHIKAMLTPLSCPGPAKGGTK